jgi:signal transduction histidine kinase/DNA-binding response OmpR family regulator/CHASE3 domain sensor protein
MPPSPGQPKPSDARTPRDALRSGFLRSSLPPRTQAGFVAATLAVFLIAFLSYRSFTQRAEGARLVAHTLEVTAHLEVILSTFQDAETGQRGFLLTGDGHYLEPFDHAVATFNGELLRLRAAIADNPQQLERFDALDRNGRSKMAELKQTIDLRHSGRPEAALEVVRTDRGKRYMDEIRADVAAMKEAERRILDARTQELAAASSFVVEVVWGGSALLLFLIAAAAALSSKDFFEQRVQGWLRTGQSEMAVAMQGVELTATLGERVAAFLSGYLDAQIGAVYFAPSAGALERVGAYALPEGAATGGPAGLTKQAYTENRTIKTEDVPSDFFPVTSGLGKSRARHLVVTPTTADGFPNGALELGFFGPVRPHDLELLARLGEPIGLALRATKDRSDLKNLLEETQRQAEELQTQQEELRVQNEELEQQSLSLQASQARLENQQVELEQINANLEEQTQALERQRDNLARAQADLQRASAYKSEFLANMSHELRTPLNSTLILAKLLGENRDGNLNPEQIKFADTIYSAGNDLLTLINDILDLSKIEAGKLDVRPEEIALPRLRDELADVFRPVARDKGIELTATIEPDVPPTMVTDSTRLQQVLKNLLSNALKFTDRGGVELRLRRVAGGRIAFDVKDTGIGVARDQQEAIFEAFRQADGTTNRKYGGTGLGLSISRDLARLLGGELTVDSAPGRGSTFTLVLPEQLRSSDVPQAAPAASRPAPVSPPGPQTSAPVSPLGPQTSVARPSATPPPAGADPMVGGRIILIIEDDPKFAGVLQALARELDFQTVVATTGEEGLAMAERYRPSAIVLDVGLPDRSGLSVLDTLKHRSTTRHVPVHVVSVDDHTQTALEMGALGYAIKPVKREQLVGALKRLETKFTQRLRRILIVEDDAVARDSTCHLLAGPDVETVAVGTAAAALAALESATFDCMVLDLSLPDRSGLELLEEMSKTERYAFPPVIVYTGRSLSRAEEQELRKLSNSIIIKGARSPERLLDEVTLFLHQVESELPPDRQRMLKDARHREAVFEGRRVLVVEDDVRNIFALSSVLEPRGAKVEIARNGREAVDHLQKSPGVDLILMDVMMPEMDGLQATRLIRQLPDQATVPIIALTAKAMLDDREQCLAAGANDYIAKPLDVDKLLSLARVWMPK